MSIVQKMRNVINRKQQIILLRYHNIFRTISTGQKVDEAGSVTVEANAQQVRSKKKIRNWQSYGYDFVDQRRDNFYMHAFSFGVVCVIFWGTIFIMSYYPDMNDLAWASREARIQIRRREVLGLPMVDPNYIDPALIKLPPDEEIDQDDLII